MNEQGLALETGPPTDLHAGAIVLDTQHLDQVHDSQVDYFGNLLATCSSDGTVKVFNILEDPVKLIGTLSGHKGPVWRVAWAHPMHGTMLASCSFDGTVIIWKNEGSAWWIIWENEVHSMSVNSIAWAPFEHGLILASASSDGKVSVVTCRGNSWEVDSFVAHEIGCCAVDWAPSSVASRQVLPATSSETNPRMCFVTGGCDSLIKIWTNVNGQWVCEDTLKGHSGWVRDVSFAAHTGADTRYLASCSEDKSVLIWKKHPSQKTWTVCPLTREKLPCIPWRLDWSSRGGILAISHSDGATTLWSETLSGTWAQFKC